MVHQESAPQPQLCRSVTEVEVIVGVGVVLALTKYGSDEVEAAGGEDDAAPDAHAVVNSNTVDEEALEATEHEVVEPLLGRVRSVVENVTSEIGRLLIEVLLSVPGTELGLRNAKSLAKGQTHVLSVTLLVVGQSASYKHEQNDQNDV